MDVIDDENNDNVVDTNDVDFIHDHDSNVAKPYCRGGFH